MLDPTKLAELQEDPRRALIAVVDELMLAREGLGGFINLVLDKGEGKRVSFSREGIANLLGPLEFQVETATRLLDHARKRLYPPS